MHCRHNITIWVVMYACNFGDLFVIIVYHHEMIVLLPEILHEHLSLLLLLLYDIIPEVDHSLLVLVLYLLKPLLLLKHGVVLEFVVHLFLELDLLL